MYQLGSLLHLTVTSATLPDRPIRRQTFDTHTLVSVVAFILLFALAVRIPTDTDTWWHLRTGNLILSEGRLPLTDPFSFTRGGQEWINHSWGSQILMTVLYRLTGGNFTAADSGNIGLALYMAGLATGGCYFIWRACAGNAFVRAFVIVITAATAAIFWAPRPHMTSFFLSAVTYYLLWLYRVRKRELLWVLPVLMIVWVNLHGGFAIGFLLLFGTIAGEICGRLFDPQNPDVLTWQQIGKLILITVICAVVLVINPNTTQMWSYPFRTVGIGALQDYIQEWNSPNFHGRETWPFIALVVGTFAAVGLGSRKLNWTDLALFTGMFFLSLYAGRNIASFAIVAAPILSLHLDSYLVERGVRLSRPRPSRGFAVTLNYVIVAVVLLGSLLKIAATLNTELVDTSQRDILPVGVAEYVRDASARGELGGRMFNSYNWGGYLMYLAPDVPVFVDGRTDLYDDALLREWLATTNGIDWERTFDKWQIGFAVIEKGSPLAANLRTAGWQERYTDEKSAVLVKEDAG